MRAGIVVNVTRADRLRLEAIVADRSAPQKPVWRAKVILATADGCGTAEIMRRSGKSKPVVGTWQARFMAVHNSAGNEAIPSPRRGCFFPGRARHEGVIMTEAIPESECL